MRHKFREGLGRKIPIWKVPSFTLKNAGFSLLFLNFFLFISSISFSGFLYYFPHTSSSFISILKKYFSLNFNLFFNIQTYQNIYQQLYFHYIYYYLNYYSSCLIYLTNLTNLCYNYYVFVYFKTYHLKEKVKSFLLINNIFIKKNRPKLSQQFFNKLKELNINILQSNIKFNQQQLFVKEFLWNSTFITTVTVVTME